MAKIKPCPSKMDPLVYAAMILQMQLKPKGPCDSFSQLLNDLWEKFVPKNKNNSPISWAFNLPYMSEEYFSVCGFLEEFHKKTFAKDKWPSEKILNNIFLQDDYYKRMTQAKELRRAQIIKENG